MDGGTVMAKLYELCAHIRCHAVIAADSKAQALAHVASWENAWFQTGMFGDVSFIEVVDVRDVESQDIVDEADDIAAARGVSHE